MPICTVAKKRSGSLRRACYGACAAAARIEQLEKPPAFDADDRDLGAGKKAVEQDEE